ncbi:MAG: CheR family methyltransferase [Polyangiaceae bacterium]
MQPLPKARQERLRELVELRLGMRFDDDKLDNLVEVASRRSAACRLDGVEPYLALLESVPASSEEISALAAALTVTETFFFRGEEQLRVVADVVVERARSRGRRLRLLSVGCASGEEAHSLGIVLLESLPDFDAWDIQIVGVDVNPSMLEKAERAVYSAWALRATPERVRQRYFHKRGRDFELDARVRKLVRWRPLNLADDSNSFWSGLDADAIFCRNVLMYFSPELMQRCVARFERALLPGGYLFLGHAETLRGISKHFELCHTHEAFYYRLGHSTEVTAPSAPVALAPSAYVEPPSVGPSWVDTIQSASRRVVAITERGSAPNVPAPIEQGPQRDIDSVLSLLHAERFAEALSLLDDLPVGPAQASEALLLRAVILTNRGERDDAEQACRKLLEADALNADAHYLLALCREQAADVLGAMECDRTAIHLEPSFSMPHFHLGLLGKRRRDLILARRELSLSLGLLARESTARLMLFGGGFSRDALLRLCQTELASIGASA